MSNYPYPNNPYSQPTPSPPKYPWQLSPTRSILVPYFLSLGIVLAFLAGLGIGYLTWGRRQKRSRTTIEEGAHEMPNLNRSPPTGRRENGHGQEGQNRGQNRGGDQATNSNHTQSNEATPAGGPNDIAANQFTDSNHNMPTNADNTAAGGPNSMEEHNNQSQAPGQTAGQPVSVAQHVQRIESGLQAKDEDRRQ